MEKYIYYFNYQENEPELCQLEFRTIFHSEMKNRVFITSQNFDYTRSVYIKGKLTVLYENNDFNQLVETIKKESLTYYEFKVLYLKNDITYVDYHETLECCKQISFPISGSVNFKEPKVLLGITKIEDHWYFGIYENEMLWSLRMHKPHSYSHSLNTRDARTLVNLAVGNESGLSIVDPCCGIGTVVLEALSMNEKIKAYDINRYVSYQARLNLMHYGYDPLVVEKKDMNDIKEVYDVAIMDIPYGLYSPFTYEEQLGLLKASTRFTKKLVLVSQIDLRKELEVLGYHYLDGCTITKGKVTRYITIAEI